MSIFIPDIVIYVGFFLGYYAYYFIYLDLIKEPAYDFTGFIIFGFQFHRFLLFVSFLSPTCFRFGLLVS